MPADEAPVTVTRRIELDVPVDELWHLIGTAAGWATWMVDDAAIVIEPDRTGVVRDAGEARHVAVTDVRDGESVRFVWWPAGRDGLASSVTLTIDEGALTVVEVFPPATPVDRFAARLAWDVRAVSAWARCQAVARV
jgi:uncharacterized protein YndB with AHSA1/START domain